MAATVKVYAVTGSGPTYTTVDSTDSASFKWGRDDNVTSAAAASIPIPAGAPSGTGTHFSYIKWLVLYVTAGGGSTTLLNRGIKLASGLATGLAAYYAAIATYTVNTGVQSTGAGDYPADSGSNAASPANQTGSTWAAISTSNATYDSTAAAATNTTVNGKLVRTTLGVDGTYAGGGGPTTLPNVVLQYDEY